jgi:hypothetical protein
LLDHDLQVLRDRPGLQPLESGPERRIDGGAWLFPGHGVSPSAMRLL